MKKNYNTFQEVVNEFIPMYPVDSLQNSSDDKDKNILLEIQGKPQIP